MSTQKILAIDLGAESGRGLIGAFDGDRLSLEVVHRFANGGVQTLDSLHWDVLGLWREILATLRKAEAEHGPLASVGVDTWGVDFAACWATTTAHCWAIRAHYRRSAH